MPYSTIMKADYEGYCSKNIKIKSLSVEGKIKSFFMLREYSILYV